MYTRCMEQLCHRLRRQLHVLVAITWLQTSLGYDETSACAKVSDEFPQGTCGPMCDPRVCNPPTFEPPNAPSRQEIAYCGCDSCGQSVWDSPATDTEVHIPVEIE